jgi:UMF1 family MFS transporter
MAAIFPIFFSSVAADGVSRETATSRYAIATTIALTLVALLAPFLGVIADRAAVKKRMLAGFLAGGVTATACMFFIGHGDWRLAALLLIAATIGANGSFVFYDALLPHVARGEEMHRLSTAGYALGYIGGGLLLALNLAWIQKPAWFGLPSGPHLPPDSATLPVRLAFLSVAVWWLLFSLPLLRRVPEPPAKRSSPHAATFAISDLGRIWRDLRSYREASLLLVAFLIYNDGIGTIIRMAVIYGTELGIGRGALIGSILLVQFVGVPFSFLFGSLAGRIGVKAAIFLGLAVYAGISVFAYFMTSATHFLILALLVGTVQGGTQALSRSLFSSMIPPEKSGEFFGFFSVAEKFAGIFGPATFALVLALTGSSRNAILSVVVFFVAGALVLRSVDVDRGRRRVAGG